MKKHLSRSVPALALACAAFSAQAAATVVPLVEVTLNGWVYDNGVNVQVTKSNSNGTVTTYNGAAGAFGGSLAGTTAFDTTSFLTYCIELEESFRFSKHAMTEYRVEEGANYFQRRRGDATIADRLGKLLTWVSDNPGSVHSADESASLQLAIWNLVYEKDDSVTRKGVFNDSSRRSDYADALLGGAGKVTSSRYSVYALEGSRTQDFLLFKAQTTFASTAGTSVPEPGSLGLVAAAVAGLALVRRTRRA